MQDIASTDVFEIEGQVYGFLARLWVAEPDELVLSSLQEPSRRELYESLGGHIPEGDPSSLVDDLGREYCACFLGPEGHLPPHQSVVEQSHFQGECLSSMNQFIDVIGLPEEDEFISYHSMPDHAGIQLGMMRRICEASESEDQNLLSELKQAFYQHHLAWIASYCPIAIERTKSEFYRGLFMVTEDFLNMVGTAE